MLRDKAYPTIFRELLDTLGIDPKKKGEAVHYGPKGDLHFYGGWFYVVGEMIEAGASCSKAPHDFLYWVGTSFPRPPAAFGQRVTAIEFMVSLPWVLTEPWNPQTDAQTRKVEEVIRRYPNTLRKLAKATIFDSQTLLAVSGNVMI